MSRTKQNKSEQKSTEFNVYTINTIDPNSNMYTHWSEGLTMYITKNGIEIELDEDEIQLLVRSLPRTVGGSY